MSEVPNITGLQSLCNESRKMCEISLIFCADRHQSFLQADKIIFEGQSHTCLTNSKKKQIPFQYFKRKKSHEVDFLYANRYQNSL